MTGRARLVRGVYRRIAMRWKEVHERALLLEHSHNLVWLGQHFETDKWGEHWYLQHYQNHFEPLRTKRLNLLEIGVGGYSDADKGGNSLRMWKAYFPHANVFGVDLYDKRRFEEPRIRIFQGSQTDERFLRGVMDEAGGIDIIIDDGSHINEHVIRTFQMLFPLLRSPGIYVVEDTQTSYWPGFGGSSSDLGRRDTSIGFLASLLHCLNHEEILRNDYFPSDFDRHIVEMHFYHNLVFIYKGNNQEGSNRLRDNRTEDKQVLEGISYAPSDAIATKG